MLPRLFVIGDSISIHYGPHLRDMLRGVFEYDRKGGPDATLSDPFHATAANGGDSSSVLDYLRQRHQESPIQADFIAINCGLHDIKRNPATGSYQVSIDSYRHNLYQILAEVKHAGARAIWVRTTPVDDARHNAGSQDFHRFAADVSRYNAVADEVMAQSRVPSLDLFSFTSSLGQDLFCDHVHFLDPIRKLQAAHFAGWLIAHAASALPLPTE